MAHSGTQAVTQGLTMARRQVTAGAARATQVDEKLTTVGPMGETRGEPRVAPVIQFYAIIGPQQYTHNSEEECTVTGNY